LAERGADRQTRASGPRTPGGARLRALREVAGRVQLWVEIEAELGTGYLQRLESGRVVQPERATLERILRALDARYSERREVLESFGYTVATPPPNDEEVAWAIDLSRQEIEEVPFPAYVLDCAHRIIGWNRSTPHLFGADSADQTLGGLARHSLLMAWFDPASPIASLVAEPEAFLPALVRAMRYEMEQFRTEDWAAALIARLHELPRFREAWAAAPEEPKVATAGRSLMLVKLAHPKAGPLQFRLSSERFVRDARFRIVYLFPADPATLRACASWSR
jgi:transcriptional regulator with XRE-family HTH domain